MNRYYFIHRPTLTLGEGHHRILELLHLSFHRHQWPRGRRHKQTGTTPGTVIRYNNDSQVELVQLKNMQS